MVLHPDHLYDLSEATTRLNQATGIFIGGGHTKTYYECYVQSSLKEVIQRKYWDGTPIAGNSAGALIMPETILLSPHDTDDGLPWSGSGLGLCKDLVVSVHFSQWNDRDNLLKGIEQLKASIGYGIDEKACLAFKNEQPYQHYAVDDDKVHTFFL
ncbi:Type 1 glutamine amidotransferase-like domain-containing protein [Radiobacillus kanasensis]|nr:Type 1 glutamine amidotransferase-like domain-containing protein [Radiobacillus kanasensis]